MITAVGDVTIGGCLTATASVAGELTAAVGSALPEVVAKLDGQIRLLTPSPSFDIGAQVAQATTAYASAVATLSAMPGGAALAATLTAAVAAQAGAQGAIRGFNAQVAQDIDAALATIASLNVSMNAGISGPNINLATVNAQIAMLSALRAELEAQQSLAAGINANLGVSGLRLYRFDGDISTAGADLQARITTDGLTGTFNFMILLPTNPGAWSALQATMRTS